MIGFEFDRWTFPSLKVRRKLQVACGHLQGMGFGKEVQQGIVVGDQRCRGRVTLAVQPKIDSCSTHLAQGLVCEYLFSNPMPWLLHNLETLERMVEGLTHPGEENLKHHVACHKDAPWKSVYEILRQKHPSEHRRRVVDL
jgi:hypothetical protein